MRIKIIWLQTVHNDIFINFLNFAEKQLAIFTFCLNLKLANLNTFYQKKSQHRKPTTDRQMNRWTDRHCQHLGQCCFCYLAQSCTHWSVFQKSCIWIRNIAESIKCAITEKYLQLKWWKSKSTVNPLEWFSTHIYIIFTTLNFEWKTFGNPRLNEFVQILPNWFESLSSLSTTSGGRQVSESSKVRDRSDCKLPLPVVMEDRERKPKKRVKLNSMKLFLGARIWYSHCL